MPDVSNIINLRLEPDYGIINSVIVHDILETKDIRPIIIAFSKSARALITVERKNGEPHIMNMVKTRLKRARVDPTAARALTIVIFYLTIITTITSFPNTIATFFGISQFGTTDYCIITLAMTLSIILPSLWLWKRKWLKL